MGKQKTAALIAIWISLISNLSLTAMKIVVGVLFNSQVLVADGVHNAGDVIATLATLSSTIVSKKPADEDHPYGHGKAEVIASGVVGIIMALAALLIAYKSVESLFTPVTEENLVALIAAILSLIWKQGLYGYCLRLGKAQNSKSLLATAYDHLADVYASIAAVVGIGAAIMGDIYDVSWAKYGDPIAGIIVSYFVMKLAIKMGRESADILMEKNVSSDKLNEYYQLVESVPEVKRIDRIRAREHGHYIIVDVRVGIPAHLNVQQGHDISRKIKLTIMEADKEVEEVLVHLNPWYRADETKNQKN